MCRVDFFGYCATPRRAKRLDFFPKIFPGHIVTPRVIGLRLLNANTQGEVTTIITASPAYLENLSSIQNKHADETTFFSQRSIQATFSVQTWAMEALSTPSSSRYGAI